MGKTNHSRAKRSTEQIAGEARDGIARNARLLLMTAKRVDQEPFFPSESSDSTLPSERRRREFTGWVGSDQKGVFFAYFCVCYQTAPADSEYGVKSCIRIFYQKL